MTIKRMVIISTFASLIAISTFIRLPVSNVPFTLQTLMIILIGLFLSPVDAFLSVFIYLAVGLLGLPVFSTGGGAQAFASPTGGFLISFLFAAPVLSLLKSKNKNLLIDLPVLFLSGFIIVYSIGILAFSLVTRISYLHAMIYTFTPYYVVDLIKLIIAYNIYYFIPQDRFNLNYKLK